MQNLLLFKSRHKIFSNGENDFKTTVVEAIYLTTNKTICVFIKYKIYQFERGLTQLHFNVPFQQNKSISIVWKGNDFYVKDCRIILPSSLASRRALLCESVKPLIQFLAKTE